MADKNTGASLGMYELKLDTQFRPFMYTRLYGKQSL